MAGRQRYSTCYLVVVGLIMNVSACTFDDVVVGSVVQASGFWASVLSFSFDVVAV